MAKRPYTRRLTAAEPYYTVTLRIPVPIYQEILVEAATLEQSVSSVLVGHLRVLYDAEVMAARIRDELETEERIQQHEHGTAFTTKYGAERPAEKPAKSIFHESSAFAEEEPFPLASEDE